MTAWIEESLPVEVIALVQEKLPVTISFFYYEKRTGRSTLCVYRSAFAARRTSVGQPGDDERLDRRRVASRAA
jgi:hypothetical protein